MYNNNRKKKMKLTIDFSSPSNAYAFVNWLQKRDNEAYFGELFHAPDQIRGKEFTFDRDSFTLMQAD